MSNQKNISMSQLESYLWGAATFLRNKIDAGDYKTYIFPLLFLKRISDVYDEEYQKALRESNSDEEFAISEINHRFQIPKYAHWNELRKISQNVGQAITKSMRDIEKNNKELLFGIFGDANWGNKERLPDDTLINLIEHFSKLNLSLSNVPNDEMGLGYEYLIKKFADDSGHTAAEFYTNRTVVTLMTKILAPKPNESIYDPTCGSGGMLLESVNSLKRAKKEYRNLSLFGQEKNLMTSDIARMNLLLHGIEDFQIHRGDTLKDPGFLIDDKLKKFNVILANPPYSISKWDQKGWKNDPHGRNIYGTPPSGRADYAFLQHIVISMNPENGRASILFPHGVLFRDEEKELRKKLVEDDKIDAVIGLGHNLFYNSPMESCIVVLKATKNDSKKNKTIFIDAKDEITKNRSQSYLSIQNIEKIFRAYEKFETIEGFSYVANLDEIKNNDSLLNIPLYVNSKEKDPSLDINIVTNEWIKNSNFISTDLSRLCETFQGELK